MAEEQLERSILESKERDELHAIASAMSLKATARSKKSDIIDLILEATGVGDAGAGPGRYTRSAECRRRQFGRAEWTSHPTSPRVGDRDRNRDATVTW